MAWFEQLLEVLKNYLVDFGVPAEQAPLAALGLVYLALTVVLLFFVLLLVKRARRRRPRADEPQPESAAAEPVATGEETPVTS